MSCALRDSARDLKDHTLGHLDQYLLQFEEQVQKSGGHVHWCADAETARRLVLDGLVHAAASDAHTAEDQGSVAAGMAWIRKNRGDRFLERLLDENPRRIVAGELPEPASA